MNPERRRPEAAEVEGRAKSLGTTDEHRRKTRALKRNVRKLWPYAGAVGIACVVEGALFLMSMLAGGPHSYFWPLFFLGYFFFLPAVYLMDLLAVPQGSGFFVGVVLAQTLFLTPPIFWLLTWKRRSVAKTALGILSVIMVVSLFTVFSAKREGEQAEKEAEIRKASHVTAVASLHALNASIAEYKARYGDYPKKLNQLAPPPAGDAVSSEHAGVVTFPLEAERYFALSYQAGPVESRKCVGYELRADPGSEVLSFLNHYFTDQTGLIRYNNQRADANSLVIGEQIRPTVTFE